MAPILILKESFDVDDLDLEDTTDNQHEKEDVSIWTKSKDSYIPMVSIPTVQKIPPGYYKVDYIPMSGDYQCTPIEITSDELIKFTDDCITDLMDEISLFWDSKDLYKKHNMIHKRGILLEGYAGTGKSSIITLLGGEIIDRGGVVFKITDVKNFFEYLEFIKYYFRKIEPDTPVITIIEDIDQYVEISDSLLDFMDGKSNINNNILLCTSNNLSEVPDTFLRPSRIDYRVEIPLASEQSRREYFTYKQVPEEDLEDLVNLSDKFTLAELKELFISVYILKKTIQESVNKIQKPKGKTNYLSKDPRSNSFGL